MPSQLLSIVMIFLSIGIGHSQEITILEKGTDFPMDNVSVFTTDGDAIGISDFTGKVTLSEKYASQSFFLMNHPLVENDTLWRNNIANNIYYITTQKIQKPALEDLTVTTSQKDYVVLEGYFTSYVTNNSVFNGFIDGKMQCIIKNSNQKIKECKALEYRSYILTTEEEDNKKVSSMVFEGLLDLPNLKELKRFEKEKNQNKIQKQNKGEITQFQLIIDFPEFHMRLFGYDFSHLYYNITIDSWSDDLEQLKNMNSFSEITSINLKHKHEEAYSTIQMNSTFTVDNVLFMDKKELEDTAIKFKRERSYYKDTSWINESSTLLELFQKIFQNKLEEQPNEYQK